MGAVPLLGPGSAVREPVSRFRVGVGDAISVDPGRPGRFCLDFRLGGYRLRRFLSLTTRYQYCGQRENDQIRNYSAACTHDSLAIWFRWLLFISQSFPPL